MTSRKSIGRAARPYRKTFLPALAGLACLGQPAARPLVTINDVADSPALIAAFARADADTGKDYKLVLRWRKDANGNTVMWKPQSTITLKRGHVYVLGSQSNSYPERYIFDGEGMRTLFAVIADAGHKPNLTLSGITVQNGYARINSLVSASGGGLYANKAQYVELYYCKFLNNKSNQPGSAIAIRNSGTFYFRRIVVDGNVSDQFNEAVLNTCGGQTSGGGGIAIIAENGYSSYGAIHKSTISNNAACRGGGVLFNGNISANMYQNTISGNKGVGRGGGIFWQGGTGTYYLRFNTIAFNRAATTTNLSTNEERYGGGLGFTVFTGTVYAEGNIVAKNQVVNPDKARFGYNGNDCYSEASSISGAPYYNYVGKIDNCGMLGSSGSWGIGTDANPLDPKLSDLLERGTGDGFALPVHQPYDDSPVRGGYPNWTVYHQCEYTDQRSLLRNVYPNSCDIGSVEVGAGLP